jgi:hypothetical protein
MISFFSASTRMVNSRRAMQECIEAAFGEGQAAECDLLLIHASIGHNFADLADQAREMLPGARVLGASCCGIIGSEGVSESMKDVAIMAMKGARGEIVSAAVNDIYAHNSFDKARELGRALKAQNPAVNMVYFLASGIDIADDLCIKGLEAELGESVTIFGATSADNMKGIVSYQIVDNAVHEHAAFAIGFADPSLRVLTRATHGFVAASEPMTVTRSEDNRIIELDGKPAWEVYTERLGLDASATCGDTIPIGALAEQLPEQLQKEYGNDFILRVVTKKEDNGTMHYATCCPEGTRLWLTSRDEELIFSEADAMMRWFDEQAEGKKPVAVFHADCLARGRYLFNKVMKEELVAAMQEPLADNGVIPPWIGMYGFGEFARLGGKNEYHNYTSALYAIYRD